MDINWITREIKMVETERCSVFFFCLWYPCALQVIGCFRFASMPCSDFWGRYLTITCTAWWIHCLSNSLLELLFHYFAHTFAKSYSKLQTNVAWFKVLLFSKTCARLYWWKTTKKKCTNYQMCVKVIKCKDIVKMHQHDNLNQIYVFTT